MLCDASETHSKMPPPSLTVQLFGPLRVLLSGEPLPRVRACSIERLLALLDTAEVLVAV